MEEAFFYVFTIFAISLIFLVGKINSSLSEIAGEIKKKHCHSNEKNSE